MRGLQGKGDILTFVPQKLKSHWLIWKKDIELVATLGHLMSASTNARELA